MRIMHAGPDFAEDGLELRRAGTVQAMGAPGGNLEQGGRLVEARPLADAVTRAVVDATPDYGLPIGGEKGRRCTGEPAAHGGPPIPQSARPQVSQKIADIERRVGAAESIEIHDANPFAQEEQPTRFESSVGWCVRLRPERVQPTRELPGEPPGRVRNERAMGRDQRGALTGA